MSKKNHGVLEKRAAWAFSGAAIAAQMANVLAFAQTTYSIGSAAQQDPTSMILNIVFYVMRIIGIILIVYGIVALVNANQEQDAQRQSASIGKVVGGGIMVGLPTVLKTFKIIS